MTTIISQCSRCKHYGGELKCEAFPGGIPRRVLNNLDDHRKHVDGDNEVVWEPSEEFDHTRHPWEEYGKPDEAEWKNLIGLEDPVKTEKALTPPTKKERAFSRFGDWNEDTIEFAQRTHIVGEE